MDTWIVFTSLWLQVSCCEHSWLSINICTDMSSFLFNAHLGVEFLGHIVTLCLTYWGTEGYFPNHCTILNSHQKSERSTFSTSLPTLITIIFQIMAILVSVKWDSTVLICVFQMTNDRLSRRLSYKESTCNAGDMGSIPGSGRSPGGGHGNPLQYSCLENPHGQRSLGGYSPRGHKESDTTEATEDTHVFN